MDYRHYESYIIVDGNLEESQIDDVVVKFEKFLAAHDTKNNKTEKIGRRRLAYPIKKRQNGFYVCYYFDARNDFIAELERNYRLDENIIRFLTTHLDEKTVRMRDEHFARKAMQQKELEEIEQLTEAISTGEGNSDEGTELKEGNYSDEAEDQNSETIL
ncbi:MAG: 30S ribosomal protein S6 [Ignavibacteriaceae bacterium]|nr:MAG: 30S ribosomal protein S6 [Chlorobiota bacterium]KXK06190.1 MAG: 30S ribosomal protein S6 [Chlorobi bacterium OLB4]MBV6399296.1 30S ribosomal protein S6 [Ignavibacteria bacterium]MCC6884969.1 30S ribosomal protein S6 [Ignavibacteriales bacterium]MCE7953500.1 30S ribosomal protein S6 [Chlorobi bacterium CHB7]MDL1887610.1 30S ribosomal protein S6 [Ignavibacteria bacterium CHB1]MEB2329262.1 30S ribosomal protein S6 [Ignavibacteriaceae bacterium]OQY78495.1 MAG: 30S ribosomal protein S6 [I